MAKVATPQFFARSAKSKDGLKPRCKVCQAAESEAYRAPQREELARKSRERHQANRDHFLQLMWERSLVVRYGISVERYNEMLADQGGCCALCRKPPAKNRLAVDHDHESGRVRGLLCSRCNGALGQLGDTAAALARVMTYLQT